MSLECVMGQPVQITIVYEHSMMIDVSTNSSLIDHFLRKVKMSRSRHTWINYAHDLKVFFTTLGLPLEQIDRHNCLRFMEQQDQAGLSSLTINRRLATVSSLFHELNLLDPILFPQNPVAPLQLNRSMHRRGSPSLYRKQPQRVPDVISEEDLRSFFAVLPTWRDRTLILLMWMSCLRIGEAVSIRFEDIECSHRSIHIRHGKGDLERIVYMDPFTFAALNKYLDEERRDLFPDVDEIFVAFKGVARGRPLLVNALQHAIDYYAARCGCSLHAHLFRHTGITQLVLQGMSEAAIRKLVGHRNINSLLPYLHLGDTFVAAEFEKAQHVFSPVKQIQSVLSGGEQ
ncbi:MAG TPA: tyrosine-type recombinase/integrase [Ktedonobacteraceae bacterium]|nr:tyrosine-type recombinase/integrase [Ktedonobacteraceae bacterium]